MAIAFRCCSGLWPKNISWIASDQCYGKKFSDLFTGSYRLIQFNNYKGSMRSWLRMKKTASWTDVSHLRNQDGKSSFSALRWHILYIVIILTLVYFFLEKITLVFDIEGVDGYGPVSLLSLLPMLQLRGFTSMVVSVQGRRCLWTCSMNSCKSISSSLLGYDLRHTTLW